MRSSRATAAVASLAMFLSICPASAKLDIESGSLSGTEYDEGRGLSDKQLGILRWIAHISAVGTNASSTSWDAFNTDPDNNTGMDSVRYALAFLAYATSAMTYEHTPAYRQVASEILADLVKRMVDRKVWSYWATNSQCGNPWTTFCHKHNTSMCTLNNLGYSWRNDPCPDPVAQANIMYSGHLAQMGLLYELHSADPTLSTEGWVFQGEDWTGAQHTFPYTLPKLLDTMYRQSNASLTGGGITCEPGNVFPSCNSHTFASFRLYDAMRGTRLNHRAEDWFEYLMKHSYHPYVQSHPEITPLGDTAPPKKRKDLFTILVVPPIASFAGHGDIDIPFKGCASHDGWVVNWLNAWAPGNTSRTILEAFTALSKEHLVHDHTGGTWLNDTCLGQATYMCSTLSSSWLAMTWRQLSAGQPSSQADSIYTYFEKNYGTAVDSVGDGAAKDMYYYNATGFVQLLATANLALAMAAGGSTLQELFSTAAVAKYALNKPHLAYAPWPDVMVRRAKYDEATRQLSFTVLPSRRNIIRAKLVCKGIGDYLSKADLERVDNQQQLEGVGHAERVTVRRNGAPYHLWTIRMGDDGLQLDILSEITQRDTGFVVEFNQTEKP